MVRKEREIIARKNYGFRKTPSADLLVQTDKDRRDVPKEATLVLPMDGTLGRLFHTAGTFNIDAQIPSEILGLGVQNDVRALTYRDSSFVATLAAYRNTQGFQHPKLLYDAVGANEDDTASAISDNYMSVDGQTVSLSGVSPVQAWPFDNGDQGDDKCLLMFRDTRAKHGVRFSGQVATTLDAQEVDANGNPVVDANGNPVMVANESLSAMNGMTGQSVHDLDSILHHALGVRRNTGNSGGFVTGVQKSSSLYTLVKDKSTYSLKSDSSNFQHLAKSMVQLPGEYVRNNERVLRDLMSHLPYFKELDSTGYFQKGFRSGFWSRFSDDELRVMGEMIHFGMSMRFGQPVRNCHIDAATFKEGQVVAKVDIVLPEDIGAKQMKRILSGYANGDTLVDDYFGNPRTGDLIIHIESPVTVGPCLWKEEFDLMSAGKSELIVGTGGSGSEVITYQASTSTKEDGTVTLSSGLTDAKSGIVCTDKTTKLLALEDLTIGGKASFSGVSVDKHIPLDIVSFDASVNPFFVNLERASTGEIEMTNTGQTGGKESGIHNQGAFACVPGLQTSISPALVEEDTIQPTARDISFEDLWAGLSYLFESDGTEGFGKHWASCSHIIRALSPDFKTGAIHDFRSQEARTNVDLLTAAHYFGLKNPEDVRLRNAQVHDTRPDSYFTKGTGTSMTKTTKGLPAIYGAGGLIDTSKQLAFVEDVRDLSLRNFQMTNEFIAGQQSVGEAESSVYHRQLADGTEHTIKTKAFGASFGRFLHVKPTGFNGRIFVDIAINSLNGKVEVMDLYKHFCDALFPRTRDEITYTGPEGNTRYVGGSTSWVPFAPVDSHAKIQDLMTTSCNQGSKALNKVHDMTVRQSDTALYHYYGDLYTGTIGEYIMDLTINNPVLVYPEISSRVYKRILEATGGQPYKANIEMRDLIEVNLVKQVTFSTGSPAVQQMLNGMMTYLLSDNSGSLTLFPRVTNRRLWDRNIHKRPVNYTVSDGDLVPMLLPKTVDGSGLVNLIASSHILAHELGLSGIGKNRSVVIDASSYRTIYRGYVDYDGIETDLAITLASEGYDFASEAYATNLDFSGAVVPVSTRNMSTASIIPGMLYYSELFPSLGTSTKVLCEMAGLSRTASDINSKGTTVENLLGFATDMDPELISRLDLKCYSEIARELEVSASSDIDDAALVSAKVSASTLNVVVAGHTGTVDYDPSATPKFSNLQLAGSPKFNQLPKTFQVSGGGSFLTLTGGLVLKGVDNRFGIDKLNAINFNTKGNSNDFIYHDRGIQFALISQDIFDNDSFEMSCMLHSLRGQMIVGPCPLLSLYGPKGDLVSSVRDVLSTVGSGEKVLGTKASATAAPSDIVSADDTNDPEPQESASDTSTDTSESDD